MFFFGKKAYLSLLLFLKLHFFYIVVGVLYMFWILIPYEIYKLQIFSHSIGGHFTLLIVSLGAPF